MNELKNDLKKQKLSELKEPLQLKKDSGNEEIGEWIAATWIAVIVVSLLIGLILSFK